MIYAEENPKLLLTLLLEAEASERKLEKEIERWQTACDDLTLEVNRRQGEICRLEETLAAAQAALKEYGDEMVEARAEIERLAEELRQYHTKYDNAEDKTTEIERLRAQLKAIGYMP